MQQEFTSYGPIDSDRDPTNHDPNIANATIHPNVEA